MNPITVVKVAYAIGTVFGNRKHHGLHVALICKDTRISNYMFEGALQAGLTGVGMDVDLTGPLPTPAAAWLTGSMRDAAVGIVLTASQDLYYINGIQLFGPDGSKSTEEQEHEIERLINLESHEKLLAQPDKVGKARRIVDGQGQYVTHVKSTLPNYIRFGDMRVLLDCAHGALYEVAPRILHDLGAEVFFKLGYMPNGLNINEDCGSAHPQVLTREVRKYRADVGIAFDGDGSHVMMADEQGQIIDSSQMSAILAASGNEEARFANPANDGFITALQVMSIIQSRKQKASEVFHN